MHSQQHIIDTVDSMSEPQQQNHLFQLPISMQTLKRLLEEDSNNIQAFTQNFLSQFPLQKYNILQENSTVFLDRELVSLVCQKGPLMLEPRTFVNLMTLFAFIGM
jgi:UDP-galactopyranose mutase